MDLNYTSAHARVFEGVRMARIRAFNEMQLPEDEYKERCIYADRLQPPQCDHVAEGLWVHAPGGGISPLCRTHLENWLECGDDVDDEDPPALIPLRNRRRS